MKTVDDVINNAPSCGGNPENALLYTKELLQELLPGTLARVNAGSGRSIPQPKGYYIAGTKITSDWPNVIVGWSVESSNMAGLGRIDQDHLSIAMYYAFHRIESEPQILACLAGILWMRNVIFTHRGGQANANNLKCWDGIEPGGFQRAPQRFPDYEGLAYHFRAWQPGTAVGASPYWPPLPPVV